MKDLFQTVTVTVKSVLEINPFFWQMANISVTFEMHTTEISPSFDDNTLKSQQIRWLQVTGFVINQIIDIDVHKYQITHIYIYI